MLTEQTVLDFIGVDVKSGEITVRHATQILQDGQVIAVARMHQFVLPRDADVSAHDPLIQRLAMAAWAEA